MCGIIGYVGGRPAVGILLDGLQRLEYRGYDSAGVALLDGDKLQVWKRNGKLSELVAALHGSNAAGNTGIGHTRWATHGRPSDLNAHPHLDCRGEIAVIHNGIVENYAVLRAELEGRGHRFRSETDSEVLAHLLEERLTEGSGLEGGATYLAQKVDGSSAIVALWSRTPGHVVALRLGNAGGIVVGYGEGESFLASDLPALLPHTRLVAFLEDRQWAVLSATGVRYGDAEGAHLLKEPVTVPYDPVGAAKAGYKHFMLKEIMEQPRVLADLLGDRVSFRPPAVTLDELGGGWQEARRSVLIGMGTSLHAAMLGRLLFERLARLPAEADNASEFRYREPLVGPDTLVVSVGQSGETVDTLAAMEQARLAGCRQITLCNVVGSQATRIADAVLYLRAGLEVGVASTKCFTASVTALVLLGAYLGQLRQALPAAEIEALLRDLYRLPHLAGRVLSRHGAIEELAHRYAKAEHFLYLGRGAGYPTALEGALKLKEVSYIHAEGYPAGEMKHGPIALIDERMPVLAIALQDNLYAKMISNIEEAKARDGAVIAIATEGDTAIARLADHVIEIPPIHPLLSPILAILPLQLFAYHIAVRRGCDVDQPRNLAKTVTVE